MARSIRLAPRYSDWTKSQLVERLKKVQHQIDEREAERLEISRLAAIVESSADAIVAMMVDGTITDWNRTAEKMFGYTAEEAIGEPITIVIPDQRLDEIRPKITGRSLQIRS